MTPRRLLILVITLLVAVGIWQLRIALAEGLACYAAGRMLLHKAGYRPRRRPKASWAKNGEAAALLLAAWSIRGLVSPRRLRAKPQGFSLFPPRPKYDGAGPGDTIPYGDPVEVAE